MKRLLSVAMLWCLLLSMLPMAALAAETETTGAEAVAREPGSCGDGLTWTYAGGTLTISGSGEMDDYITAAPPWADYKHDITRLVFTGGVTYVGAYAFTDYDELESVDFGTAMHTIGEQAFYSCDGLTSFTLPASFRCFGQECFMSCQNLEYIYCEGGMPSFRNSCLWDTNVTVFYPPNNAWPADAVQQLLNSFQFRITIQPGTAPAQQTSAPVETQATEPPVTEAPTVPETTQAATVPSTQATEPTEVTEEETTAPTTRPTEPEWLHETYASEETQTEKEDSRSLSMGVLVGVCIIAGILSLMLIGALVFRRRG